MNGSTTIAPVKPAYSWGLALRVADQVARGERPDPAELAAVRAVHHPDVPPDAPVLGSAPAGPGPDDRVTPELVEAARAWMDVASLHWEDDNPEETEPDDVRDRRIQLERELYRHLDAADLYGLVADGTLILSVDASVFDFGTFAAANLSDVAGLAAASAPSRVVALRHAPGEPEDLDAEYDSADDWPAWTDDAGVTLAPPEDARLGLYDLVAFQADAYRAIGNSAGDLLADTLSELLVEIEITHASDPETLIDRRAALLDARIDQLAAEAHAYA